MTVVSPPSAIPVKKYDIVRVANGDTFIVTSINYKRPVNPYTGVLINGTGAEWKFGPKHRPVVTGHASDDHPALLALRRRLSARAGGEAIDDKTKAVIGHLLEAVEKDNLPNAKILAAVLRTMGL